MNAPRKLTAAITDTTLQAACNSELEQLLQEVPDVRFANLSLLDGRVFVMASRSQIDPQRIAALSSSLLALSESFAREIRGGRCSHVTVSMENGAVVTVRVPTEPSFYTLSLFVADSANLAMALRWTLDAARRLSLILAPAPDH